MILTSYHCFNPNVRQNSSEDLVGIAQEHELYKMYITESSHRKVIKVHSRGQAINPEDDLAIVNIDRAFNPNDSDVSFACLIQRKIDPTTGLKFLASGFGFDKRMINLQEEREAMKKNSKVEWQYSMEKTSEYSLKIMRLESEKCKMNLTSLICASGKNESECIGDTGISILYELDGKLFVAGVSGGLKDKRRGCSNGEFTSVYSHLTWIDEITGSDICPPAIRITGGFNAFMTRIGIAYFIGSAILLVLLTSLLKRNDLVKSKPADAEKMSDEKKLENVQGEDKQVDTGDTGASDMSKTSEDVKKADERVPKPKIDDEQSESSLKT